jgi:hypothetical protein
MGNGMAYQYDVQQMLALLDQIIRKSVSEKEYLWLQEQLQRYEKEHKISFFNLTFTAIPRFVKKAYPASGETIGLEGIQSIRQNLTMAGWSADRLARSWWLLHLPAQDAAAYTRQMENLFKSAEMNEQVALYGTLPLFAYPEDFRHRASEGVRNNIGSVFEAVVLDNPYPSEYLEEAAWNQLVLKAFFMAKPVNRIIGLDERANARLAHILSDYAHERWAASRPVSSLLWRPVGRFLDEGIFPDIRRLSQSGNDRELQAALLACAQSDYEQARELLDQYPLYKQQIEAGKLTWEMLTD